MRGPLYLMLDNLEGESLYDGLLCEACFESNEVYYTEKHPYMVVRSSTALDMLEQKYEAMKKGRGKVIEKSFEIDKPR